MRVHSDILSGNPRVAFVRVICADVEDIRLASHLLSEHRYRFGGDELGHLAVWIVQITEDSSSALAGVDARGFKPLGHSMQAEITSKKVKGGEAKPPRDA